jgi:hypothetical protein
MWVPDATVPCVVCGWRLHPFSCSRWLCPSRVPGSAGAQCSRSGAGAEEDTAHALLECPGIREAAVAVQKPVRTAHVDGPRPATPAAPRRAISKLLTGAQQWRNATKTLHTVPAGKNSVLASAVTTYLISGLEASLLAQYRRYTRVDI